MQKFIRCIIFEKIEILILETKPEHLRRRKINHHHCLDLSNEVLTITRLVTRLRGGWSVDDEFSIAQNPAQLKVRAKIDYAATSSPSGT